MKVLTDNILLVRIYPHHLKRYEKVVIPNGCTYYPFSRKNKLNTFIFNVFAEVGLFPVVFNLAARARITTNATCGEREPETYCRLVEHVRRRPGDKIQCGTCDAHSQDARDQHPVSQAIDGSNRWWQSPSIAEGLHYHWVTVTLDLLQVSTSSKHTW